MMKPFFFLLFFFSLLLSLWAEEQVRSITWDTMKGRLEFEDPFTKLTSEQIYRLAVVARTRQLEKNAKEGKRAVSEAMLTEKAEAEQWLREQKVDIEGLFAKREEITRLRKQKASEGVEELDGKLVELSGFVLPLEYDGKKVKEFLLVPWVGACIHTPPPPPNQICHVVAEAPFLIKGTFEAVTVTGVIQLENRETELFLVDGTADIPMSYIFESASVKKYKHTSSE